MTVSYERATCRLCEQPIRKIEPQPQTSAIPSVVRTPQGDPYKWETDNGEPIWFCAAGIGYHQPKIVQQAAPAD
jgi:hypothetical protein